MIRPLLLLGAIPAVLAAQQARPIRLINAPDAKTSQSLLLVNAVRQLPNGSLLVNDVVRRQLLLYDPSLANVTVIADSTSGGANSYGPRPGALIPYVADSTLFIDPVGLSMLVIDPSGKIARVGSVPRSQDAQLMANSTPGTDAKGRIVYRGLPLPTRPPGALVGEYAKNGFVAPEFPDSVPVFRVDPATRKVDTAGFVKVAKQKMNVTQTDRGITMSSEINPLPVVDDYAVLSDGSIAIARGQDYHIDWINPDGSTTTSPKMPFDWQRLSDDDKTAVIDSARTAMEKARANMLASGGKMDAGMLAGMGAGGGGAGPVVVMRMSTGGDGGGGRGAGAAQPPALNFVSINELPDYRPPFAAGALRGDLDGNLWIRTTATRPGAIGGGTVYDVVNRNGEIVDRLQIPAGRQIVGFGKGGVVYMLARDDKGAWLERTKR